MMRMFPTRPFIFACGAVLVSDASGRPSTLPLDYVCTVKGEKLIQPVMSADAVCARFIGPLSKAAGRPLRVVHGAPAGADWIKLDVRFAKPGIAAATLSHARRGRIVAYPEITVATSDRPLDTQSIDMLARGVVQAMTQTARP